MHVTGGMQRDSVNDFDGFLFPSREGRISDIRAACNYPIRNANFKSCFLDKRPKSGSFLDYHFLCHS